MSDEVANPPAHGDPDILPKGETVRPSAERMPFGPSGELLPQGPALPADFLRAPDLRDFPQWDRSRGQEWTDAIFRAEIFSYISAFFSSHDWARTWQIVELAHSPTGRPGKLPTPVLIFRFREASGEVFETSQGFPTVSRTGGTLAARLLQVTQTMEALRP